MADHTILYVYIFCLYHHRKVCPTQSMQNWLMDLFVLKILFVISWWLGSEILPLLPALYCPPSNVHPPLSTLHPHPYCTCPDSLVRFSYSTFRWPKQDEGGHFKKLQELWWSLSHVGKECSTERLPDSVWQPRWRKLYVLCSGRPTGKIEFWSHYTWQTAAASGSVPWKKPKIGKLRADTNMNWYNDTSDGDKTLHLDCH